MLLKFYWFGILLSILTIIFVMLDLKFFKLRYNTPETSFELEVKLSFEDLWTIFIPVYNVITAISLFYQVNKLKEMILEEIGYKHK